MHVGKPLIIRAGIAENTKKQRILSFRQAKAMASENIGFWFMGIFYLERNL
jgi:hypothetical protein